MCNFRFYAGTTLQLWVAGAALWYISAGSFVVCFSGDTCQEISRRAEPPQEAAADGGIEVDYRDRKSSRRDGTTFICF